MSQENAGKARHQKSKLLTDTAAKEYAVISTESHTSKVPFQKRKAEAKEILYFNRI